MKLSKNPIPTASSMKQVQKKQSTFAYKYSSAVAASRQATCNVDVQSTDKRRKYMRRGSKTPAMMLFDCLDWNFLSYDLSQTDDTTSAQSSYCPPDVRLSVAMNALAAASECLSDSDVERVLAKQRKLESHAASFWQTTFDVDSTLCTSKTTRPTTSHVDHRHMSLMSALKQQMETTTISPATRTLRRHLSSDLML